MMRVPGRKILRRAMRPLKRKFFPGAVVLGYHSIADDSWDPLGLAVSPRNFAEQLDVLRSVRKIISLSELFQRFLDGEPLHPYAVLTFDDGYQDFADTVVPMALARQAPVTVFVASGCIEGCFWWEELVNLMAPNLLDRQDLEISFGPKESMRFVNISNPVVRIRAVNAIAARLGGAEPATIESTIQQLRHWARMRGETRSTAAPMTEAALANIAKHPMVHVGAHTVSHRFLERLVQNDQYLEISGSKLALEKICGRPVRVFSYPHGSFSRATPRILQTLGFLGACASMEGSLSAYGNPFIVPRNWVPDISGPAFRAWLGNWV